MYEAALLVSLTILFLFFAAKTFLYRASVKKHLKFEHEGMYKQLLMSESFDINEIKKHKFFDKFIREKEYLRLEDSFLTRTCCRYVFYGRCSLAIGLLLLLVSISI
ncbi:hypothetical protein BTJ40_09275 [Microbulbifer sp. A4B17]|nr:hypothetical protein BTJ40_09275 [Microbulbifer sp. A4B17]